MSAFDTALKRVIAEQEEERLRDPGAEGRRRVEAYLRPLKMASDWNRPINEKQ